MPRRSRRRRRRHEAMTMMTTGARQPHVIVVGGGFGGLWATRALASDNVRITLIDRRNHHLFQPLLYQVATAGLSSPDIAAPLRHILRRQRNVEVRLGEVTGIDASSRIGYARRWRRAGLRLSAAGQRRDSRLLRPRRMERRCAGAEDPGRRAGNPAPVAARLRACGSLRRSGRTRGMAQFRHRRRRSDRRGIGRHAGGDRAAHAQARVPPHRSVAGARAADRSRAARAGVVSRIAVGEGARATGAARRRSRHRHSRQRDRCARVHAKSQHSRRYVRAGAHGAVGGWRRRFQFGFTARHAARPRRARAGRARPERAGTPRDLRCRRPGQRAAGRQAGARRGTGGQADGHRM